MRWTSTPSAVSSTARSPLFVSRVSPTRSSDPTARISAVVISSPKWRELGFVLADGRLADAVVEAMFGGTGAASASPPRPITKLDRRFVELALTTLIEAGNPVFEKVAPLGIASGQTLRDAIPLQIDDMLAADNRAFVEMVLHIFPHRWNPPFVGRHLQSRHAIFALSAQVWPHWFFPVTLGRA